MTEGALLHILRPAAGEHVVIGVDPNTRKSGCVWGTTDPRAHGRAQDHEPDGWALLVAPRSLRAGARSEWMIEQLQRLIVDQGLLVDLLALEELVAVTDRPAPQQATLVADLKSWARERGIPVLTWSAQEWRRLIVGNGQAGKEESAGELSLRFPRLAATLPEREWDLTDAAGLWAAGVEAAQLGGKPAPPDRRRRAKRG